MLPQHLPPPLDQIDSEECLQHSLKCGEKLFLQGDRTAGLFYMISGGVDLQRTTHAGHTILMHRARAGETFAEASLFSDSYHCSAIANLDSRVIECRRNTVTALFETDSAFACTMASRFALQIQQSRRRVELLSIRAADERILAALMDGLLVGDIADFADAIGLAPETVYRTLAQLTQREQIVKTARGQYQVKQE